MQQIRIVDDATRTQDATRIPDTENMRLTLSAHPDQTWIARLRQLVAATPGAPALTLHVEGTVLVFACADRADLLACRRLIGQLVDQTNAGSGNPRARSPSKTMSLTGPTCMRGCGRRGLRLAFGGMRSPNDSRECQEQAHTSPGQERAPGHVFRTHPGPNRSQPSDERTLRIAVGLARITPSRVTLLHVIQGITGVSTRELRLLRHSTSARWHARTGGRAIRRRRGGRPSHRGHRGSRRRDHQGGDGPEGGPDCDGLPPCDAGKSWPSRAPRATRSGSPVGAHLPGK